MWIKRLLGFDPVPVPPHVFGLDGGRLRYGCFAAANGGFEFREYQVVELDGGLFGGGPLGGGLREPGSLREPLEALMARVSAPVTAASLVLPDSWLRLAFTEIAELPRAPAARDEVLRWKLHKLVPFRVEELRLTAAEVAPLPRQQESHRMLLGFALDQLLSQVEAAFRERRIRLGQIANESLSLMAGLQDACRAAELAALVLASPERYGLLFLHRGEPVLHRSKALPGAEAEAATGPLVLRDLKLTRAYLADQLGEPPPPRILVVCPPEWEAAWVEWLAEAFEVPVYPVGREHLPLTGEPAAVPLHEVAPLFGAARQEVA